MTDRGIIATPGTIRNGVLFGTEGELFLAQGGHNVLEIATGRKKIAPENFATFEANILSRAAFCATAGIKFLHVIFPDKQSVLRSRFPFPNPVCLGKLYEDSCPAARSFLVNLTDMLRDAQFPTFKMTDTHPTDHALAEAAARIAGEITGSGQQNVLAKVLQQPTHQQMTAGDLGSRFDPPISSLETAIKTNWPTRFYNNDVGFGNDGLIDIHISPTAPLGSRVVWFGDSFGRGCVRLLTGFFRELVFLRTRFFHPEMIQQIKPDMVITQNVERYMDVIDSDEEAPPFLLYPALKGVQSSTAGPFNKALAATLSYPQPPYQRFITEITEGF